MPTLYEKPQPFILYIHLCYIMFWIIRHFLSRQNSSSHTFQSTIGYQLIMKAFCHAGQDDAQLLSRRLCGLLAVLKTHTGSLVSERETEILSPCRARHLSGSSFSWWGWPWKSASDVGGYSLVKMMGMLGIHLQSFRLNTQQGNT